MFKHHPFPKIFLFMLLSNFTLQLYAASVTDKQSAVTKNKTKHTKTNKDTKETKSTSFRSPLGLITFNITFNYPDKSGIDDLAIATETRFGDIKPIHNTGPIKNMTTFSIDFGRDPIINFIVQIKKDNTLTQYQGTCSLKTTPLSNYGYKIFNINKFKINFPQTSHDGKPSLQIEQTFPDPNAVDQVHADDIAFSNCYLDKKV